MIASTPVLIGTPTPDQLWGLQYLFTCDWANGVTLTQAFQTDISKTLADNEQRWGLTPVPFRTLEAELTVYGKLNIAMTRNLIARASFARWLVPLYCDELFLTANGSSHTIFCDTTSHRYFIGQRVAIVRFNNNHCEPVLLSTGVVSGAPGDRLVLDITTGTFLKGDSVFPLMEMDISLSNVIDVLTDDKLQFKLQATETLGPSTTPTLTSVGSLSYPGSVLSGSNLLLNPDTDYGDNSKNSVGVTRSGIVSQVGKGKVASLYGARHRWSYELAYSQLTRAKAIELINFFEAVGGRLKPFWVVSPTTDIPVTSFGTTSITMPVCFPTSDWAFYTHVAVLLVSGGVLIKAISSVTRSGGSDIINVSSFGTAPALAAVQRVGFAHFMRLDSDEFKESWTTDGVLISSLSCLEVFNEADITLAHVTDLIDSCGATPGDDPDDPAGVPIIDPPPIDPDDPDVFSYMMLGAASPAMVEADSFATVNGRIQTGLGVDTGILDGFGITVSAKIAGVTVRVRKVPSDPFTNFIVYTAYEYSTGLHGMNDPVYFEVDESNKHQNIDIALSLGSSPNLLASAVVEVLGYLLTLARNLATFDPTIPTPVTLTANIENEDTTPSAALDGQTIVVTALMGGVPVNLKKTIGGSFVSSLNFTVTNYTGGLHGFTDTVYVNATSADSGKVVAFTATILDLTQTVSSTVSVPFIATALGTGATTIAMNTTDAASWVSQSIPAAQLFTGLAYSASLKRYVAVANTGAGSGLLTSDDGGKTWVSGTPVAGTWTSVCWSPVLNLFCAVNQSGTTSTVMTSPTGLSGTWTSRSMAAVGSYFGVCWNSNLGLFCATGNTSTKHFSTSPDGTTWTQHTSSNIATTKIASSEVLPMFVAIAGALTTGTNDYFSSPDGTTWTLRSSGITGAVGGICCNPAGIFVAVGAGGKVMTSTTGTSWVSRTAAAANDWASVCWSPTLSLFIAVSTNGTNRVMASPDGISWTSHADVGSNVWNQVAAA